MIENNSNNYTLKKLHNSSIYYTLDPLCKLTTLKL